MSIQAIPAATTPVKLLGFSKRAGASIYNASNKNMYVALYDSVSPREFTLVLAPGSFWELPESYKGDVYGLWMDGSSGAEPTGSAMVTQWNK